MTDLTAKIAAKGCTNTGLTEDLIARLHDAPLGRKVVAVVELATESRTEKRDGKEAVTLSILTLEPATDAQTEDHLREVARALHKNRHLTGGDPAQGRLNVGDEPSVGEVLAAGAKLRPHPFLPDDAANENPICDVCGSIEASAVHSLQVALDDQLADADQDDDTDDAVDPDLDTGNDDTDSDDLDEEDEPHAFVSDDDTDCCRLCGRFEADGQGIHVTDNQDVLEQPDEPVRHLGVVPNPFDTPKGA